VPHVDDLLAGGDQAAVGGIAGTDFFLLLGSQGPMDTPPVQADPDRRSGLAEPLGRAIAGKERWWTWCFRAELFVLYHIDAHRNGEVLMSILGKEYAGVLGCDYLSTYLRYMRECNIVVQFCLAHLIRDVKFLTTLPDE
jgi:hypothetical protein